MSTRIKLLFLSLTLLLSISLSTYAGGTIPDSGCCGPGGTACVHYEVTCIVWPACGNSTVGPCQKCRSEFVNHCTGAEWASETWCGCPY